MTNIPRNLFTYTQIASNAVLTIGFQGFRVSLNFDLSIMMSSTSYMTSSIFNSVLDPPIFQYSLIEETQVQIISLYLDPKSKNWCKIFETKYNIILVSDEETRSPRYLSIGRSGTLEAGDIGGDLRDDIKWKHKNTHGNTHIITRKIKERIVSKNLIITRKTKVRNVGYNSKYEVSENGMLTIKNVDARDSGLYQVSVKSCLKKISKDIHVETGCEYFNIFGNIFGNLDFL